MCLGDVLIEIDHRQPHKFDYFTIVALAFFTLFVRRRHIDIADRPEITQHGADFFG